MQIQSLPAVPPGTALIPRSPLPVAWVAGQLLTATVVSRPDANTALLEVANQLLVARTPLALRPGQQLTLRIDNLVSPPLLRVVRSAAPDAEAALEGLRKALPRQRPVHTALAALDTALRTAGESPPALPRAFTETAVRVINRLPEPTVLSEARGLRAAVRDSGLFLEAELAANLQQRPRAPNSPDLKAELLRMLAALRPTRQSAGDAARLQPTPPAPEAAAPRPTPEPQRTATPDAKGAVPRAHPPPPATPGASTNGPQTPSPPAPAAAPAHGRIAPGQAHATLRMALEGALHRIETQQILSATAHQEGTPTWHLELPLNPRHAQGSVFLSIRRGPGTHADPEAEVWSVDLRMEPPGMGPIQARVSLRGTRVSTLFSAAEPSTAQRLQTNLQMLREAMHDAALTPDAIQCRCATPGHGDTPVAPHGLLSTRA